MIGFYGYQFFTVVSIVSAACGCTLDRSRIVESEVPGVRGRSGSTENGGAGGYSGVGGSAGSSGTGGTAGILGRSSGRSTGPPLGGSSGRSTGPPLGGSGGRGTGPLNPSESVEAIAGEGGQAGVYPEPPHVNGSEGTGGQVVTSAGVPFANGWSYYEVQGALCRDGSPAGYYLREGASKNLMVFLNGGGVCYSDFFCAANPANVDESVPGETIFETTVDMFMGSIAPVRQVPPDEGILKRDRRNPVSDWNMVYVPNCTGDVFAGTTPNAPVITSASMPPQNFVGYTNIGLFYQSFGPRFMDSDKVLLAGTSSGGYGALLNFDRTQEFFRNSTVFGISDSGIPFRDQYLETCIQKNWRELWGIDKILPADCAECFHADGGGLTELSGYVKRKYPGRVLGGSISSDQDEVMKLFYAAGLYDCSLPPVLAMSLYPSGRFRAGLADFVDNVLGGEEAGSYTISGTQHQHLFRRRYYHQNSIGMTIAEWVGEIIAGNAVHVGVLP